MINMEKTDFNIDTVKTLAMTGVNAGGGVPSFRQ